MNMISSVKIFKVTVWMKCDQYLEVNVTPRRLKLKFPNLMPSASVIQ